MATGSINITISAPQALTFGNNVRSPQTAPHHSRKGAVNKLGSEQISPQFYNDHHSKIDDERAQTISNNKILEMHIDRVKQFWI
jgi:hypothetical protein